MRAEAWERLVRAQGAQVGTTCGTEEKTVKMQAGLGEMWSQPWTARSRKRKNPPLEPTTECDPAHT